jgi:hypothetical protein
MAAEEFQGVLERIVRDEDFRAQVRDDPEYLGAGFDLSPGEAGLLNALVESAYGRSERRAAAAESS